MQDTEGDIKGMQGSGRYPKSKGKKITSLKPKLTAEKEGGKGSDKQKKESFREGVLGQNE